MAVPTSTMSSPSSRSASKKRTPSTEPSPQSFGVSATPGANNTTNVSVRMIRPEDLLVCGDGGGGSRGGSRSSSSSRSGRSFGRHNLSDDDDEDDDGNNLQFILPASEPGKPQRIRVCLEWSASAKGFVKCQTTATTEVGPDGTTEYSPRDDFGARDNCGGDNGGDGGRAEDKTSSNDAEESLNQPSSGNALNSPKIVDSVATSLSDTAKECAPDVCADDGDADHHAPQHEETITVNSAYMTPPPLKPAEARLRQQHQDQVLQPQPQGDNLRFRLKQRPATTNNSNGLFMTPKPVVELEGAVTPLMPLFETPPCHKAALAGEPVADLPDEAFQTPQKVSPSPLPAPASVEVPVTPRSSRTNESPMAPAGPQYVEPQDCISQMSPPVVQPSFSEVEIIQPNISSGGSSTPIMRGSSRVINSPPATIPQQQAQAEPKEPKPSRMRKMRVRILDADQPYERPPSRERLRNSQNSLPLQSDAQTGDVSHSCPVSPYDDEQDPDERVDVNGSDGAHPQIKECLSGRTKSERSAGLSTLADIYTSNPKPYYSATQPIHRISRIQDPLAISDEVEHRDAIEGAAETGIPIPVPPPHGPPPHHPLQYPYYHNHQYPYAMYNHYPYGAYPMYHPHMYNHAYYGQAQGMYYEQPPDHRGRIIDFDGGESVSEVSSITMPIAARASMDAGNHPDVGNASCPPPPPPLPPHAECPEYAECEPHVCEEETQLVTTHNTSASAPGGTLEQIVELLIPECCAASTTRTARSLGALVTYQSVISMQQHLSVYHKSGRRRSGPQPQPRPRGSGGSTTGSVGGETRGGVSTTAYLRGSFL